MPDADGSILGSRIGAALLDLLALLVLLIVIGLVAGGTYAHDGSAGVSLSGASAVLWMLLSLAYFLVAEALTGQTLGKRALGIRVVAGDGSPLGWPRAAVRTGMRIIDFLPFLYLVGFLSITFTGRRRARLGDLAAGSAVVRAAR